MGLACERQAGVNGAIEMIEEAQAAAGADAGELPMGFLLWQGVVDCEIAAVEEGVDAPFTGAFSSQPMRFGLRNSTEPMIALSPGTSPSR